MDLWGWFRKPIARTGAMIGVAHRHICRGGGRRRTFHLHLGIEPDSLGLERLRELHHGGICALRGTGRGGRVAPH